jgi:NADP-dependent 3-hydroxy acid dehydrogenase YdfG
VKYTDDELARIMQPEDLADAMKFVAALHPRTSVTELVMYPTFPKSYSPAETGLPA